jgi:hypothetical protein
MQEAIPFRSGKQEDRSMAQPAAGPFSFVGSPTKTFVLNKVNDQISAIIYLRSLTDSGQGDHFNCKMQDFSAVAMAVGTGY